MIKSICILILAGMLSACGMTPTQKKWTAIGVSIVATGLVIAHQDETNPRPVEPEPEPRAWK